MTKDSPANPQHSLDITDYPRRWFAAAVMMVAALMDMIDGTVVNVALPTIHRHLGATGTQLEWIVSAYMLAFAVMLITTGSLGDVFGRKHVFVTAIALFGLASLGAGLAQTPNQLIAARVIQGIAAAAMTPQVLATFRSIFRGKELGQAYAMFGMVLGFASAVGLVLGGLLTQADLFGWGWRTIFFVNLPVALISFVASLLVVPESRDRSAGRPDVPGAVLLTAALVAVVYPLLEGRQLGWPLWTWFLLAGGLIGLGVLGVVEARRRTPTVAPLLRPELFRVPAFIAGLTVQLLFSGGLQGFSLMFVLWLQIGQHFSPLHAGVTLVAFSVGSFIAAPFSISLVHDRREGDRYGGRGNPRIICGRGTGGS
jgi:MFS family permease